jgi:CheY-like chemotaxis protein
MEESVVPPTPTGRTVLVVEDEPAILAISARMITSLGHTALSATGPAAALSLAKEHPGKIDLLLTDVVMPGMNGKALAEVLRALHPELKLCYMSGFPAGLVSDHGNPEPGVEFLSKPFTLKTLKDKLAEMLD